MLHSGHSVETTLILAFSHLNWGHQQLQIWTRQHNEADCGMWNVENVWEGKVMDVVSVLNGS